MPNSFDLPKWYFLQSSHRNIRRLADNQTQQFFRFNIQVSFSIGVGIQIPEAFDDQVVITENDIVHPGSVIIKFFYKIVYGISFKT